MELAEPERREAMVAKPPGDRGRASALANGGTDRGVLGLGDLQRYDPRARIGAEGRAAQLDLTLTKLRAWSLHGARYSMVIGLR